ncbi:MAG: hypothetical protein AVDCRST_MAG16-2159, partial [uncultured Frankineae bacterium]
APSRPAARAAPPDARPGSRRGRAQPARRPAHPHLAGGRSGQLAARTGALQRRPAYQFV